MALILIVDDLAEDRTMMDLMLTGAGHHVLHAHDGEQALRVVQNGHPDLILLDIRMPGLSGYDVAERLRGDPATASIPLIFVTAWDELVDRARSREFGSIYLQKPFREEELVRQVRNMLRLHDME